MILHGIQIFLGAAQGAGLAGGGQHAHVHEVIEDVGELASLHLPWRFRQLFHVSFLALCFLAALLLLSTEWLIRKQKNLL